MDSYGDVAGRESRVTFENHVDTYINISVFINLATESGDNLAQENGGVIII